MMHRFSILDTHKRIYGLDLLRTFAILSVVYEHGYRLLNPSIVSWDAYDFFVLDGVSVFFVLSGYLIGQILIKTFQKEVSIKDIYNFWIRRWCRTLPAYFLVLTILAAWYYYIKAISISTILPYYLFSQNLFYQISWFFPESWSLSIEEWFYLIVPLLIFLYIRCCSMINKKAIVAAAITIIIVSTSFRIYYTFKYHDTSFSFWDLHYRKQVVTRLDSLMYGILTAYVTIYYKEWLIRYSKILFAIGVLMMICAKYFLGFSSSVIYNNIVSFSFISISTAFLIPFLASIREGNGIIYKAISIISIISYSMYLINLILVQDLLLPLTFKLVNVDANAVSWEVKYLLYLFYTFAGAYFIFIFWERPTTAWREKLMIKTD